MCLQIVCFVVLASRPPTPDRVDSGGGNSCKLGVLKYKEAALDRHFVALGAPDAARHVMDKWTQCVSTGTQGMFPHFACSACASTLTQAKGADMGAGGDWYLKSQNGEA